MSKLHALQGGGFSFWCPGCEAAHQFPPGARFNGNWNHPTIEQPLFVNPVGPGMQCHLRILGGNIKYLAECSHTLRNGTVPMVDWP